MKQLQTLVEQFCKKNQIQCPIEHRALDLTSEVGELAKEILKATNYGKQPFSIINNQVFIDELGDTLFSLIAIANLLDIKLEKALLTVLKKYEKRMLNGSAGSENT